MAAFDQQNEALLKEFLYWKNSNRNLNYMNERKTRDQRHAKPLKRYDSSSSVNSSKLDSFLEVVDDKNNYKQTKTKPPIHHSPPKSATKADMQNKPLNRELGREAAARSSAQRASKSKKNLPSCYLVNSRLSKNYMLNKDSNNLNNTCDSIRKDSLTLRFKKVSIEYSIDDKDYQLNWTR